MIKYVLAFVAALLVTVGCASLADDPVIVTTQDNVKEEFVEDAVVVPTESLPEDIAKLVPEDTFVVIVEDESWLVNPEAPLVKVGGDGALKDDTTFNTLLSTGLGVASTFIPGLAAWEGVITLFSRRKRRHYLDSLKKAVPHPGNTKIDLVGAVASLGKAIGAGHSTETTAAIVHNPADTLEAEAEEELAKAEA